MYTPLIISRYKLDFMPWCSFIYCFKKKKKLTSSSSSVLIVYTTYLPPGLAERVGYGTIYHHDTYQRRKKKERNDRQRNKFSIQFYTHERDVEGRRQGNKNITIGVRWCFIFLYLLLLLLLVMASMFDCCLESNQPAMSTVNLNWFTKNSQFPHRWYVFQ